MKTPRNPNSPRVGEKVKEAWSDLSTRSKVLALGSLALAFATSFAANSNETSIKPERPEPAACAIETVQEDSSQLEAAGQAFIEAQSNNDLETNITSEDAIHTVNTFLQNNADAGKEIPLTHFSDQGTEIAVCLNEDGSVGSVTPLGK